MTQRSFAERCRIATLIVLAASLLWVLPSASVEAGRAAKGALIGAGVGALVGGGRGAAAGAVTGAIVGAATKKDKKDRRKKK